MGQRTNAADIVTNAARLADAFYGPELDLMTKFLPKIGEVDSTGAVLALLRRR